MKKLPLIDTKEDIKISSIELTICYKLYDHEIELHNSTFESTAPSLAILDKEADKDGRVIIDMCDYIELVSIMEDFQTKLNLLIKTPLKIKKQ